MGPDEPVATHLQEKKKKACLILPAAKKDIKANSFSRNLPCEMDTSSYESLCHELKVHLLTQNRLGNGAKLWREV